jgi:hypothetical protein
MKHVNISFFILLAIITLSSTVSVSAQRMRPAPNTTSKMLYHDGPVMAGDQDIYFIWYGCWTDDCGITGSSRTVDVLSIFTQNIGGSPYFQMNSLYTNAAGQSPTGAVFYGSSVFHQGYTHGLDLTQDDIADLVRWHIEDRSVPQDPLGIYVVIASANVASNSTGFCSALNSPPLHGTVQALGAEQRYLFIGNPNRCPTLEGSQFIAADGTTRLPTPNNDFAGDAMVARLAHGLNTTVTNPNGNAWYDRYGFENADKCQGQFGETYTTANGARANVRLGGRDYLIWQNWVNDKRGRCAMHMGL